MTESRQSTTKQRRSLDPASSLMMVWFAARLGGLMLLTWAPCLVGTRTPQDAAALLSFACSIGATVCFLFASLNRVPLGQGSLNGWDEGMAFIAVARLAHLGLAFAG